MDGNRGNILKDKIQNTQLSEEAKSQLLPLVDFLDNPEVKQRFLEVLQVEESIIDAKLKYVNELQSSLLNISREEDATQGS